MLRGAIDLVRQDQISGWLYSDVGEVDNRVVLAFVDDQCVGSGPIGLMREDLKAVGLGDGRLGFSFGISLEDDADLPRVMVKIDGSDVFLLQQTATIARPELFLPVFTTLARIEWMRSKGLLAPSEITFLKYMQQLGAFEYSLVQVKIGGAAKAEIADPRAIAQAQFDLLCLRRANLKETVITVREAEEIGLAVLSGGGAPMSIVALTSTDSSMISIVEGSHANDRSHDSFEGAIDYRFGHDLLLFLDLKARFRLSGEKPVNLRVFSAC